MLLWLGYLMTWIIFLQINSDQDIALWPCYPLCRAPPTPTGQRQQLTWVSRLFLVQPLSLPHSPRPPDPLPPQSGEEAQGHTVWSISQMCHVKLFLDLYVELVPTSANVSSSSWAWNTCSSCLLGKSSPAECEAFFMSLRSWWGLWLQWPHITVNLP